MYVCVCVLPLFLCVNRPLIRWQMVGSIAEEIDRFYRVLASSNPPLVHPVTRPVKPLCHSGREIVTNTRAHTHCHINTHACTHRPFQLLDQSERDGLKRQKADKKKGREIDFLFTGEKTEVLFTDLRAI